MSLATAFDIDTSPPEVLANVLVVSRTGKAIVLLYDPQQLDQPIQGNHPEETDVSALINTKRKDKDTKMDQRYRDHLLRNLTDFEQRERTEGFVRFGVTGKKAKRPNYQIESESRGVKEPYFGHNHKQRKIDEPWNDNNITSTVFKHESLTKDSTWNSIRDLILKKDSLGKGESIAYEDEKADNSTGLGQEKFRKLLIEKWGGCSVTKVRKWINYHRELTKIDAFSMGAVFFIQNSLLKF